MTKPITLTEAYQYFGIKLANRQWSWSGRNVDHKLVVLTLWVDEFVRDADRLKVDFFSHPRLHEWQRRPGNRERMENLIYAIDNSDRRFRVVLAKTEDTKASVRRQKSRRPAKDLVMEIININETTGEFSAISVEGHKEELSW